MAWANYVQWVQMAKCKEKNSGALCRSEHSDAIAFAFESTQPALLVAYLLAACARSQRTLYQQKAQYPL
jgi:hypothetical protein